MKPTTKGIVMSDNNSEVRPENETTEAPPAKKIRFAKTKKFYQDYKFEFNKLGVQVAFGVVSTVAISVISSAAIKALKSLTEPSTDKPLVVEGSTEAEETEYHYIPEPEETQTETM